MFRRWRITFVRGTRRLCLAGILMLIAGWCYIRFAPLPSVVTEQPPLTALFLDCKGRLIAELAGTEARSHRPIPLAQMGVWIPKVTIALEDRRFENHPGIDWRASLRALWRRHGGGSTITQQYVKVAMGRRGRSLSAKLHEALIALQLEHAWSKQRILEAYLNRISYGNRLIGIEAAAQAYFHKPAATLTLEEATFLAGLPQSPSRRNPWKNAQAAARQFQKTKITLEDRGIVENRHIQSMLAPAVERHLPRNLAPHFVRIAARGRGPGVFPCTLDLDLQRRAEQLVRQHLTTLHRPDISQAALVIMDNESASVRALVGSRDFEACQTNGAFTFRNSGSTLKPFLYVTGIDRRVWTAATVLPDTADAARDAYGDYDPHNFILSHLGPVRVREALGNSLNVPAVVAVNRIGARTAFDAIADWGIRFDRPLEKAGAGFILGNAGVRLIDLTAAFAGLARQGLAAPTRFLEDSPLSLRRVASRESAAIVTDILCDNSARLCSFGPNSVLSFPVRVAAKTGTSAGYRDAWAEGFTQEHTLGVWVGNFDGRPMDQAGSIAAAGPLWRRMMDELLQDDDHPLPEPQLTRTSVCALSGLRPCDQSPRTIEELFLPGTEPLAHATNWFGESGQPLLPKEYTGWCASADNQLGAAIQPDQNELTILTPRNGAVFLLDDNLPLGQQQLELRINSVSRDVTWTINGKPITPHADGRVLWPLSEGEWALEVAEGNAHAASRFEVRRR